MFLDLVHRLNSAKQNLGPDLTETIGSYNTPANLMTRRKSLPQVCCDHRSFYGFRMIIHFCR